MTVKIFKPGIYWRGIRITEPIHSVVLGKGFYVVPFAAQLVHVSANVGFLTIDKNVTWVCWNKYWGRIWFPKVFNSKAVGLRPT